MEAATERADENQRTSPAKAAVLRQPTVCDSLMRATGELTCLPDFYVLGLSRLETLRVVARNTALLA